MTEAIPRFPLQWPTGWSRAAARKRAQFNTKRNNAPGSYQGAKSLSVADGTGRVLRELAAMRIGVDGVVISTNIALRLDGYPKSGQGEPTDPGVAVYWRTSKGEARVMAVDVYDRVADNLAAIAASLDALRAIERHGGAQIGDRAFTGFDALPPPPDPFAILGVTRAANKDSVNAAWRAKVRAAADPVHGSQNLLVEINVARDQCLAIIEGRA